MGVFKKFECQIRGGIKYREALRAKLKKKKKQNRIGRFVHLTLLKSDNCYFFSESFVEVKERGKQKRKYSAF